MDDTQLALIKSVQDMQGKMVDDQREGRREILTAITRLSDVVQPLPPKVAALEAKAEAVSAYRGDSYTRWGLVLAVGAFLAHLFWPGGATH